VRFTFEPWRCGLRLAIPARPGDRVEYSVFLAGSKTPYRRTRILVGGGQQMAFTRPARTSLRRGYASGSDAELTRATLHFARARDRAPLRMVICPGP
jgi:hypothetical protein